LDYQKLNAKTKIDPFLISFINAFLDTTSGHKMYSFLETFNGYNHLLMHLDDYKKMTFMIDWSAYTWKVMTFNLKNGLTTFH